MEKNDGGPAFATPMGWNGLSDYEKHLCNDAQRGMSLRDYFAARAMQGLIHDILIDQHWEDVLKSNGVRPEQFQAFLAHLAYGTADAMLAERDKQS